jgi:hypothetical protein
MKSSIIEVSKGHSLGGIDDFYFRLREEKVLEKYLKRLQTH